MNNQNNQNNQNSKNTKCEQSINISLSNIMNKKFCSFPLVDDSKKPACKWQDKTVRDKRSFKTLKKDNKNYGIVCGKVSQVSGVDLDLYKFKDNESEFIKEFGEDYIKTLNTLTIRTPSGGEHLYFKYTPLLKTTTNKEHLIDIRNDGSYLVAPYSKIGDNKYKIINKTDIKDCPEKLLNWLIDNLYKKKKIKKKTDKSANKTIKKSIEDYDDIDEDFGYIYNIYPETVKLFIDKLMKIKPYYKDEYSSFLKLTTFLKALNMPDIWREMCDKYIPSHKLEEGHSWGIYDNSQYNKCKITINIIDYIISEVYNVPSDGDEIKSIMSYFRLKPTDNHNEKPDENINRRYVDTNSDGKVFTNDYTDEIVVIKSDTGTGKTTAFKNFIKEDFYDDKPFISIVSRISLGKEQVRAFRKAKIKCIWHDDIGEKGDGMSWYKAEGSNIVITIDSLMKMTNWDNFEGYNIYLDEFNSLVEYFINCPNLADKRVLCYKYLLEILKQADRVIATDADISDTSLRFLQLNNLKYKFISNSYKNNEGIKASEISVYSKLLEELISKDKYMICCDSKKTVDMLYSDLKDPKIKIFTSESDDCDDLDNYEKVIFSPKIIYGLDSLMERSVYCIMKERTISPNAMVQQLARCRNIIELKFLFTSKIQLEPEFNDLNECVEWVRDLGKTSYNKHFKLMIGEQHEKNFNELFARDLYNKDCQNTNKFAHFIKLICDRGFIYDFNPVIDGGYGDVRGLMDKKKNKKIIIDKVEDFRNVIENIEDLIYKPIIEEFTEKYIDDEYPDPDANPAEDLGNIREMIDRDLIKYMGERLDISEAIINKLNLLQLNTPERMDDYADWLFDDKAIGDYFKIRSYFYKCQYSDNLMKMEDFKIIKISNINNQLLFVDKILKHYGIDDKNDILNPMETLNNKDENINKILNEEYSTIFRNRRTTGLNFIYTSKEDATKTLYTIYEKVFGDEMINKKPTTKDIMVDGKKKKKKIFKFALNEEFMKKVEGLIQL